MSARDHVIRRPAQVRPAPESGVRLVDVEEQPALRLVRGWAGDVRAMVREEFQQAGGRVFRDDDLVAVREGGGW